MSRAPRASPWPPALSVSAAKNSPPSISSPARRGREPRPPIPAILGGLWYSLTESRTVTPRPCSAAGGETRATYSPSKRSKSRKDGSAHEAEQVRRDRKQHDTRERQASGGQRQCTEA